MKTFPVAASVIAAATPFEFIEGPLASLNEVKLLKLPTVNIGVAVGDAEELLWANTALPNCVGVPAPMSIIPRT